MSRGVLYIVYNSTTELQATLQRSIDSLRRYHQHLPVHVEEFNGDVNLLVKARMGQITPFEQTLFLDADTIVCGPLDFGFRQAERFGLACCICEAPYARRYDRAGFEPDAVEYNTGVIFWTDAARSLMEAWEELAGSGDWSVAFVDKDKTPARMPDNDQGSFAMACERMRFSPFALPPNWNFRPKWYRHLFGPLRVWHDPQPVPQHILDWSRKQDEGERIGYARLT